jgi:hypothetical protein
MSSCPEGFARAFFGMSSSRNSGKTKRQGRIGQGTTKQSVSVVSGGRDRLAGCTVCTEYFVRRAVGPLVVAAGVERQSERHLIESKNAGHVVRLANYKRKCGSS